MKRILIDAAHPEETRVVLQQDGRIQEFDSETTVKKQLKGNIYLAKVTRVEPSLQAAFVEYGEGKQGFLPFSEINPDYYHIPAGDKKALMESLRRAAMRASAEEDVRDEDRAEGKPSGRGEGKGRRRRKRVRRSAAHAAPVAEVKEKVEKDDKEKPSAAPVEAEEREEGEAAAVAQEEIAAAEEAVVTGSGEEEKPRELEERRMDILRRYKIQEVIRRGQIMLVQVDKEERGNKGASLTSYVTLAGRYCVLMPNTQRQGGVSRRIASFEDRRRLKKILESMKLPQDASVIIRTAGAGHAEEDIRTDYNYLANLWNNIRELTLSSTAPAFIHGENDVIKRSIRDLLDDEVKEVLIQGAEAYKDALIFAEKVVPDFAKRLKEYRSRIPLFARFKVEEQIHALYHHEVMLQSGGYVVINPTEALISIDVNSGKSTSSRDVEQTALATNLEAAREVARQLRLRDLSGLIVIDFIDMMDYKNRKAVERALREAFQNDRARIQLGRISIFGLLEMSRQRLRPNFLEVNTVICPTCAGTGRVRAVETMAAAVLRTVAHELSRPVKGMDVVEIGVTPEVVSYILNYKRHTVAMLERMCNVALFFIPDVTATQECTITRRKPRPVELKYIEEKSNKTAETLDVFEEDALYDEGDNVTSIQSASPKPKEREVHESGPVAQGAKDKGLLKGLWQKIIEQ